MADEALKTLLCLPGKHRNYAVEFPYAEEICKDMMISLMPCLPGHFAGVCNYKGSIVPVVCQEGSASGGEEASEIFSGHPSVSGAISDSDWRG